MSDWNSIKYRYLKGDINKFQIQPYKSRKITLENLEDEVNYLLIIEIIKIVGENIDLFFTKEQIERAKEYQKSLI